MIIDNEFSQLMPPLLPVELEILESNIKVEGIRDPLIIWNNILIDGHNRFNIAEKLNISYKTKSLDFKNRDEVKLWIINNQLARRNISSYDRVRLNLKYEEILKLKSSEHLKTHTKQGYQKSDNPIHVDKELAKLSSVSHDTVFKVKFIEQFSTPEQKNKLSNQSSSINKIYHETKKNINQNKVDINIELPKDNFSIIYADPPWKYNFSKDISRSIESHYPTMDLEQIKKMNIPSSENSVLFLWSPSPKLEEALEIMKSWGFIYKTCAVWDKEIIGMGYWFRSQHELLLLGVKGKVNIPLEKNRVSSIIKSKRKKHSQKPLEFYDIIEKMFPSQKYLELFARNRREGWKSWGNELT